MKRLSLYIHLPFCVRKCDYCDFLSFPVTEETKQLYLNALRREIREYGAVYADRMIDTVFFGGGTPSVLGGEELSGLMETLRDFFFVAEEAEISLEANPGTADAHRLQCWRRAGVNRLSIGCQSLRDAELRLLGRIHDSADFYRFYDAARAHGFGNINVDLISALPGQKLSDWEANLRGVAGLAPEHISAYGLIIEENTPFYARYHAQDARRAAGEEPEACAGGMALLPTEEAERDMYHMTGEVLREYGYGQYELSNHAKPGRECRHNLVYWKRGDYLGLGLGAASCVDEVRWKNSEDMGAYLSAEHFAEEQRERAALELGERRSEAMFLGLRLTEGIDGAAFAERYGETMQALYGEWIQKMCREDLLEEREGFLRLTVKGRDLANYVMAGFV
ncbi:MAG: radical SAM family heme chaperone HemW [Lachnospiraceae bacterium]|nr:radical SAM family heme chaperone HemW [Lachnospiraceae bacterium]